MRSVLTILTFSFLLIFQSCGNQQVEENIKLREEVIAVHDEVMPKMGQLKSLEKTALQMAEDLSKSQTPDEAKIQELKSLAVELDQAYENMFVWMRQYEIEDGDKSPEEVKLYLEDQMIKVTQVNEEFKAVLAKAETLIKN